MKYVVEIHVEGTRIARAESDNPQWAVPGVGDILKVPIADAAQSHRREWLAVESRRMLWTSPDSGVRTVQLLCKEAPDPATKHTANTREHRV